MPLEIELTRAHRTRQEPSAQSEWRSGVKHVVRHFEAAISGDLIWQHAAQSLRIYVLQVGICLLRHGLLIHVCEAMPGALESYLVQPLDACYSVFGCPAGNTDRLHDQYGNSFWLK